MDLQNLTVDDPILRQIGAAADESGIQVFVVGGYVRDLILGTEVKDIDIVVLGPGVEFAKGMAARWKRSNLVVYERFGTAMLQLDDRKVEFVGARKESYTRDSRKPAVDEGTLSEDLLRRDFTMNAIAVSLNRERQGQVHDPLGGQRDLQRRLIRTPLDPEKTFDDDPLRILRAIRFSSQLSFTVDPAVVDAGKKMRDRLKIVSQERITDEFLKIVASPKPSVGLQLAFDMGVLEVTFPELQSLAGVDQRQDFHHKDVFKHTLLVVDNLSQTSDNLWLRMAGLLHDIAKPRTKAFKEGTGWTFHGHEELGARMVKTIFRRMHLSHEHIPYVEKLVRLHLRPMALVDSIVTDSAVRRLMFDAGPEIDDLMKLCRADITSKNPKLVTQVRNNYDLVLKKMEEVEEKDRIRNWQPPLRGEEIMEICQITPSKLVGILKDEITDAILDGVIPNDHDAAREYLLRIKDDVMRNFTPLSRGRE
ncbi:MAG TPA: HD domain-containing protein [Bacteroidota bacterium]|nr:HD domain-containing protein [Bacteroidota bacterium]